MRKLTTEEFIEKARKVHGDKYDYSKVEYVNDHTKICIICPEHGEFWQTPNRHLQGCGCPKCGFVKNQMGNNKRKEEYKRKIFKILLEHEEYDISKTQYINSHTPISIKCIKKDKNGIEHGEFCQEPVKIMIGHLCPKCGHETGGEKMKSNKEDFIEKARKVHGDKYDYSKVEYVDSKTPVCIICPIHGEFWQTPNIHLSGGGCQFCQESHLENELCIFFSNKKIKYERWKKFTWLRYKNPMSLDFYLPDFNIAIECQGIQHFKKILFFQSKNQSFELLKKRDETKYRQCKENNVNLIYYTNIKIDFEYIGKIFTDKNEILKYIQNDSKYNTFI